MRSAIPPACVVIGVLFTALACMASPRASAQDPAQAHGHSEPPPPRPQRHDKPMPPPQTTPGRIAPAPQPTSSAPPQTTGVVGKKVVPKTPTHLFSIEPFDLFLFGTLNVEYEVILGDLFGLAVGGRARLWSPFGGQFTGHSLRFAPRFNIVQAGDDAISFIGFRADYTVVESNQRCEGDFVGFCGGDVREGYALGGFAGANVLFGEAFFGTLAIGLSYSSLDNPEWTLFNPDFRFVFDEDPNLSGDLKPKGRWIPYLRAALGFYL